MTDVEVETKVSPTPDLHSDGAFEVGETVRNRRTGEALTVTADGVWLPFYYERVPGVSL